MLTTGHLSARASPEAGKKQATHIGRGISGIGAVTGAIEGSTF